VDISLVPGCRGQGLGAALLKGVLAEEARGLPVTITSATQPGPAPVRRLRFRRVDSNGVPDEMEPGD
jgi:hypothetical protein